MSGGGEYFAGLGRLYGTHTESDAAAPDPGTSVGELAPETAQRESS